MADEEFININPCPKCGGNHPNLHIRSEEKIIFRGADPNLAWIIVMCPYKNEEFKVRVKRNI